MKVLRFFITLESNDYDGEEAISCTKDDFFELIYIREGGVSEADVIVAWQTSWTDQFCGCIIFQIGSETLAYGVAPWNRTASADLPSTTTRAYFPAYHEEVNARRVGIKLCFLACDVIKCHVVCLDQ